MKEREWRSDNVGLKKKKNKDCGRAENERKKKRAIFIL